MGSSSSSNLRIVFVDGLISLIDKNKFTSKFENGSGIYFTFKLFFKEQSLQTCEYLVEVALY